MLKQIASILEDKIYNSLKEQVEKYSSLTAEEWSSFSSYWEPCTFRKNQYMTKAGQVENWFYFVYDGVLRLYAAKDGEEINAGFTYNNDFSGEYASFLSQEPTEFYIQAITDCSLLRISYKNLMYMFDELKCIERFGRQFNAKILIDMAKRQLESRSFTAEEKYKRLLTQSPHILQLVPQKHLASYLGMTPETFSRLRAKVR
ncbi:Crp/Fnr family transcriptional regulator [Fulvivirga lutimaris]|uniref:Crp/Fnr family transcriptional regulator n=1 Tax=Fulvivirga lutimaris TaxID=1819566 RepID=UPI0012BCB415|nr:Crp/Fnr family transcriptional regulator [Fulvivirga lutimaris]MTI39220.1 Crp/Fnr family transcriptional regulator [Fulvivirga lutimaris]